MEEALRVAEAVGALSGFVEAGRAFHVLKRITLEHRIQGAPGLGEAVRAVEEILLSNPLLPLEVRDHEASPSSLPRWVSRPPEWSVEGAGLEARGERLRLEGHPTLAVAHSPPGGPVEAEVVEVREWWEPSAYEAASGRIALTSGPQDVAYLLAARAGAEGLIAYNPKLSGDAVPYKGLFLPHDLLSKAGIPAVGAPSSLAAGLSGSKARLSVDSSVGGDARLPYLEALLPGRSRGPRVAVVAHICHPRPGANDNASGAAAVVEAALALAEAIDSGRLRPPGGDIVFLLVPEYTGSLAALARGLRVDYAINVDMVGVEPGGGDGPLRILPPPPPLPLEPAAALYYALKAAGGGGWELSGPSSGSDHDAFNAYGMAAAMLNQWPDTYYHSDRDDADRISPSRLRLAALAAAAAAYALASGYEAPGFREYYTRLIAIGHASRGDGEAARLAGSTLRALYGLEPLTGGAPRLSAPWEAVEPSSPIVTPGSVTVADVEAGARLRRILGSGLDGYTWYLMEPVILANQGLGAREILAVERAVHGSGVSAEKLWEALEILAGVGAVKLE
ncbi:MAG: M28 family peptidase [Desulfurococcales archaeon]|nr:M28 family peptidase [Desulfurococcales archaeon]